MSDEQRRVAGRYRLLSRLGAGGMGTVWRAEDVVLGREVAVKEITFPHGLSAEDRDLLRERTRREARAAARLVHPSAVTVYDVVEHEGAPYLVMELVEAPTLADVVRGAGPLSAQRTAQVGLALLGALEAAHGQGIVHRDVKPSNVLLGGPEPGGGRVVLTDFGIATTTGDASITSTGLLLGSPAYIAPERARGLPPGPPSDLWSLGATLFTAVEGRPPFEGDTPLTTVTAVVTGEHAPFALAGPLAPLLDGLLEKDPERRLGPDGARQLLREVADRRTEARTQVLPAPPVTPGPSPASRTAALELGEVRQDVAQHEGGAGGPVPPVRRPAPVRPPLPARSPARRRWLVPALAAALLLGAGGAAVALSGDGSGTTVQAGPTPAPDDTAAEPSTEPAETPEPDEQPVPAPEAPSPAPPSPAPVAPSPQPSVAPSAEEGDDEDPDGDQEDAAPVAGLPAGWSTDSRAGYTVALPPGYERTRGGEYRDRARGRTLRVETGEGQPDAVADRERAAASFARRHPSYELVRIAPVDYRGYEAADWEFTYEGLRVVNRVFVVGGRGHSLFFQAPADDPGARADFDAIAAAFVPSGT